MDCGSLARLGLPQLFVCTVLRIFLLVFFTPLENNNMLFPTLAVGLLDLKVDVVLARLEAELSAQPPSIPAVPNRKVSLQCSTTKYPSSAPFKVSLQCPTAKYPCSAQPQSIPAGPNRKVSLQCPSAEYPWSAQQQRINITCSAFAVLQGRQLRGAGKRYTS